MARSRYKIYETEYPYLITASVVYGLPLFGIQGIANTVLSSLRFLQEKKEVNIYAYVMMENHIHFIAQSDLLASKVSAFKSFTARRSINFLKNNGHGIWLKRLKEQKAKYKQGRTYQFWQEGYHPKQITGDDMMVQKIEYIHNNPVKRGYVDRPEDWRYSSICNYVDRGGELISITLFKGRNG
jgi:REP element-mobilizing transposase RayT